MVFRIRFSHFLPIISSLFFLALGIYEILYLLEFLNIVETTFWCSFSLILFGIGYYIERKSLQDAISFYIFSSIFILIALWFARVDQESILMSLGFLILSLISIGILIEKDKLSTHSCHPFYSSSYSFSSRLIFKHYHWMVIDL